MWKYSALGSFLGFLVAACAAPDLPTGSATVDRSDLDTLLAAAPNLHPCAAAEVSARLGIRLEVQKESKNWIFYGATGRGAISEYDLRVPKPRAAATLGDRRAPMLIADLVAGAVRYEDVSAQLGPPVPESLDVQSAGGPTAYYEFFDRGRNLLLIGAGLDDPRTTTEVIVNCR